jgi:hypothetical protein
MERTPQNTLRTPQKHFDHYLEIMAIIAEKGQRMILANNGHYCQKFVHAKMKRTLKNIIGNNFGEKQKTNALLRFFSTDLEFLQFLPRIEKTKRFLAVNPHTNIPSKTAAFTQLFLRENFCRILANPHTTHRKAAAIPSLEHFSSLPISHCYINFHAILCPETQGLAPIGIRSVSPLMDPLLC